MSLKRAATIRAGLAKRRTGSGGTTAPPPKPGAPYVGPARGFKQGISPGRPANPKGQSAGQYAAPAAPPAAPPQAPMPWDVAASNDEAAAERKRDNAQTGLSAGWLRSEQDYGLQGPWADYKTNPYSQAALLQRQYQNAQQGTKNSYAAGGHLYSGALLRAREGNTTAFDQSRDQLVRSRDDAFAKNQAERVGADDAYNEAKGEAGWRRVNAGIAEEPDATAAPAGKKKRKSKIRQNISKAKAFK